MHMDLCTFNILKKTHPRVLTKMDVEDNVIFLEKQNGLLTGRIKDASVDNRDSFPICERR